ncbi:hypothetical protein [Streptomyces sp. SAJ15]|uniref:hypothetical protein n=1 Tax=Streptomyces sp. SAJ15 TaxID=2011095 RepID=UPI00118713AE|nr:hypothetical protein [Streptomyces sp. SAJ15]TVL92402.1 hypothetical protein CD790_11975 [Streptomyces sp. SAJ15]
MDCRALLALYSDAYLRSPDCAREWSVFRERMARSARQTGHEPRALVGVVWRPDGLVLPLSVAEAGPLLPSGGQGYPAGEFGTLRDPEHWAQYRDLVRLVADRLITGTQADLPTMSTADARSIPLRFDPHAGTAPPAPAAPPRAARPTGAPRPGTPAPHPPPTAPPGPPRAKWRPVYDLPRAAGRPRADRGPGTAARRHRVTLLLLAGTRSRMAALRTALAPYGDSPEDWQPFWPHTEESAVDVVQRALEDYGVEEVTVCPFTPESGAAEPVALPPEPPGADPDPPVVLLLVDPWLAREARPSRDPGLSALCERLSARGAAFAGVVAVLPRTDAETWENTPQLRDALLAQAAGCRLRAPHHEVGSAEGLAHTVIGAMADVLTVWPGGQGRSEPGEPDGRPPRGAREPEERAEWPTRRSRERDAWSPVPAGPRSALLSHRSGGIWGDG